MWIFLVSICAWQLYSTFRDTEGYEWPEGFDFKDRFFVTEELRGFLERDDAVILAKVAMWDAEGVLPKPQRTIANAIHGTWLGKQLARVMIGEESGSRKELTHDSTFVLVASGNETKCIEISIGFKGVSLSETFDVFKFFDRDGRIKPDTKFVIKDNSNHQVFSEVNEMNEYDFFMRKLHKSPDLVKRNWRGTELSRETAVGGMSNPTEWESRTIYRRYLENGTYKRYAGTVGAAGILEYVESHVPRKLCRLGCGIIWNESTNWFSSGWATVDTVSCMTFARQLATLLDQASEGRELCVPEIHARWN